MTQSSYFNYGEKIIVHIESDLKELIPGYLKNRYKDIESISEALEQDDYESIRLLGHSMKGSGGGYGFNVITDIGRSLEQAAKDKDADEIRKWVNELSVYLELIEIVYE
ncbi:MAG TPA: Hpt domain-containing protein [Thermodesulfobacteriota bacterium]|nr:Hpt domain-containing protein [Thermodesulfobacteriota bacterium]